MSFAGAPFADRLVLGILSRRPDGACAVTMIVFGPVTLVPEEIRAALQGGERPAPDIVSGDGVTHDHVRSFIRSERRRLDAREGGSGVGGEGDIDDPPEVRVVKEMYLGNPDPASGERRLFSRDKIWLFGSQKSAPPPHDFLAHLRLGNGDGEAPALLLSDTVVVLRRAPTDLEVVLDTAGDSRFSRN